MEHADDSQTVIPFTQRRRWRWWSMIAMGSVFTVFGLAILTSPAWAPRSLFGHADVWLLLRGEAYFVFGVMQALIGIGYVRLTSRPAEAIIADRRGIAVRRLYGTNTLSWNEITQVKKGRVAVTLAATPITMWKIILCNPQIVRLDATMVDASVQQLADLVQRHYAGKQH